MKSGDPILTRSAYARFYPTSRVLFTVCLAWLSGYLAPWYLPRLAWQAAVRPQDAVQGLVCAHPLPDLLPYFPPSPASPQIVQAAESLHDFLQVRTSRPDIDSLAVAIVTANGIIFENGYGILRANETTQSKDVDRDSIYRVASISKMFTVLETLILRERGLLNWDDPIEKFIPEFEYPSGGWSEYLDKSNTTKHRPSITLRQLSSHMSGIGRDYPPVQLEEWPAPIPPNDKPDFPARNRSNLLRNIAKYPLITPPYNYPVYSNSGIDLLGLANIAAASRSQYNAPDSHKELVKRDIFDPLGFNSSFFGPPSDKVIQHIAIPAVNSEWADFVFNDADDPAGGQFSSLGDLSKIMQTILSPTGEGGVVSSDVVREWLKTVHSWPDNVNEVGAPWEISKFGKSRIYSKAGSIPGYHTQWALNPDFGYGIIVLATGTFFNPPELVNEALMRFQPVFDSLQVSLSLYKYGGVWASEDGVAVIVLENGSLYVDKLVVRGQDVLSLIRESSTSLFGSAPMALWTTGRMGEFRMAFGRSQVNGDPKAGCNPYWISIDLYGNSHGAPLDLLYFKDGRLVYPSAGVSFTRD